jgi:hypothetical protein
MNIQDKNLLASGILQLDKSVAKVELSNKSNGTGLDWTLMLVGAQGNGESISGTLPFVSESSNTSSNFNEEKDKHINFIRGVLADIDNTKFRESKCIAAKILYDYLRICAVNLINTYSQFKQTVIDKAYHLKKDGADNKDLIRALDQLLIVLGCPKEDNSNNKSPVIQKDNKENITPVNTSVNNETNLVDPEYDLFIANAKLYNNVLILANSKQFYGYYKKGINCKTLEGITRAEKMNDFFVNYCRFSRNHDRMVLMKKLFTKHNLIYNNAIMTMYDEWEKSYKPNGRSNRYIKMLDFICANKFLFTLD